MKIKEIKDNEMKNISGGDIGSTLINAFNNLTETIFNLGKEFGSSVRRLFEKNYCSLD